MAVLILPRQGDEFAAAIPGGSASRGEVVADVSGDS